jgi:hypothetical protein
VETTRWPWWLLWGRVPATPETEDREDREEEKGEDILPMKEDRRPWLVLRRREPCAEAAEVGLEVRPGDSARVLGR